MRNSGMAPTTSNLGGLTKTVTWSNRTPAFEPAVDQALRVGGSRDFADRASYERFLQDLVRSRNQTRAKAYVREQQTLRHLPTQPLAPCRELRVTVSR